MICTLVFENDVYFLFSFIQMQKYRRRLYLCGCNGIRVSLSGI
jgi:hypothetical protein